MKKLLTTKDVAQFLHVNEKMVYTLIGEKGLPATRVSGKWMFPLHLVEQWVEQHTINYPKAPAAAGFQPGLLVVAGSNDLLLDRTLALFMQTNPDCLAVFGNCGSMGGLKALRRGLCHVATSHLLQESEQDPLHNVEAEFNFAYAAQEFANAPAVVNFCRREQGLLVAKGNPRSIAGVADVAAQGLRLVNRCPGTGTRLLLDRECAKSGVDPASLAGYEHEVQRHLDVGLEILAGRADTGPAIRAVAGLLDLDFLPLRWERFDLLLAKERFFDKTIQSFLSLLGAEAFKSLASQFEGYDCSLSGQMVFPKDSQ